MKDKLLKYTVWAQIWRDENGQDLVEYGLVISLISLGAILGLPSFAAGINTAFTTLGVRITSAFAQ